MSHVVSINRIKVALLRYVFCNADTDSSQIVDKNEFHVLVSRNCHIEGWDSQENEPKRSALFSRIDLDGNGSIHMDEFCHAVTMEVSPDMGMNLGIVDLIQFKFGLFMSACMALGMSEEEANTDHDWVRIFKEADVTDTDTLSCLAHSKQIMDMVHPSGMTEGIAKARMNVTMRELCHVLSIDGSQVSDLQLLILVKHKLLRAVYRTIDVDGDQMISREEFIQAVVFSGSSEADGRLVSQQAFKSDLETDEDGMTTEPGLTIGEFCRLLSYEPREDGAKMTPAVLAFIRVRHSLLKKAFETIFGTDGLALAKATRDGTPLHQLQTQGSTDSKLQRHDAFKTSSEEVISRYDFAKTMEAYGLTNDVGIRTYMLLDVNHEHQLTVSDIQSMMCGSAGMSDNEFNNLKTAGLDSANVFDALYGQDYEDARRNEAQGSSICIRCLKSIVESRFFNHFIGCMIFLNAIIIGYETEVVAERMEYNEFFLSIVNTSFVVLFMLESLMKIMVYRLDFFKDQFNIFDFLVACTGATESVMSGAGGLFPGLAPSGQEGGGDGDVNLRSVSVLRVFRLLRIVKMLRAVAFVRELRILVTSLITGIRALGWALVLLVMFLYISAVFACQMIGQSIDDNHSLDTPKDLDNWEDPRAFMREYFGSVRKSMLTMFQVMTLESWANGIMRPVESHFPYMWIFFTLYVCFTTLAMLNLITGVFVEQTLAAAKADYAMQVEREVAQRKHLIAELTNTFSLADDDGSGVITEEEFKSMIKEDSVIAAFKKLGIPRSELPELFELLDSEHDGTLELEEFVKGVVSLHQEIKPRDFLHLKQMVGGQGKQSLNRIDKILTSVQKLNEKVNAMGGKRASVSDVSRGSVSSNIGRGSVELPNGSGGGQLGVLDKLERRQPDSDLASRLKSLEETQTAQREMLRKLGTSQQDMNEQLRDLCSSQKLLMDHLRKNDKDRGPREVEMLDRPVRNLGSVTACCMSHNADSIASRMSQPLTLPMRSSSSAG